MAEGGTWSRSFKDSFSKGSGDADESFCDPCKILGDYIAVEGYCPICEEYLCENCLGVHRRQKITRAHAILDKKQMPSGQGSIVNQDLCVEVCKTHHPEIIRFYCKAHDEPGCGDCMALNHRTCNRERVQDISDGFLKTNEFKDIDHRLQQLYQELEEMRGELDNNLKNLETTYNTILQKIATVRKEINQYLDEIEKNVTDEAVQMKKDDETKLKMLQAQNLAMKAEIEAMLKTLHDSNVNVSSLFVTTKQAKHRLSAIEKENNNMKQSQQEQYELNISDDIKRLVSAKTPLGKLSRRSSHKKGEMTKKQDPMTPRTPVIHSTETYNKTPLGKLSPRSAQTKREMPKKQDSRTPTINFTATFSRSIIVQHKTDKKTCYINDCTLLSPNVMVVTDLDNANVKLIDLSKNAVISTHSTHSAQGRVTALSTNMIAITLYNESKIQVLDVTSTLTLQREIKTNIGCWGIAYKDGKFAVSYNNPGRVEILDIQGKILYTIQPKQGKDYILQEPDYITFGHDNDTVIVSDWDTKEVSIITFSGLILHTYTHHALSCSGGIVMTPDGVLYVCSLTGECIHAVSPDFKTSRIIINNDGQVENPRSITYCDISHRLYIGNTPGPDNVIRNQIQVYDLKEPV